MQRQFILAVASSLLISLFLLFKTFSPKRPDIVFANTQQLFEYFKMTRDMKKSGEALSKPLMRQIDSLQQLIVTSKENSQSDRVRLMAGKRDSLRIIQQAFVSEKSSQIWDRINSYTKEFAQQNNYEIIIAAQQGTIMLGEP